MIKELKGAILVISGPSGCGKSTLLKEIYKIYQTTISLFQQLQEL